MNITLPKPGKLLGSILRLPGFLYRDDLGKLLGHRFLLVAHRGRKSGRVYETVLEVVYYDPRLRESYVLSAWGERSDWYRNIQTNPAIRIRTGGRRYAPLQRFLTPEEAQAVWAKFKQKHPIEERLARRLFATRGKGDAPGDRAPGESVTIVSFRPRAIPIVRRGSDNASY